MDGQELRILFGTPTEGPVPERLEAGGLAAVIAEGAVMRVEWQGAEVLRGIACPLRDRNWLTHAGRTIEEHVEVVSSGVIYRRRFDAMEGSVTGTLTCTLSAEGRMRVHVVFRAERNVTVNRAGFVVLHPIEDEAGTPLTVIHADGREETTSFPRFISPGQPVRDIRALAYEVPAARLRLGFEGDVFEMEDQRNWTDASFKTYCRPLSLPFPYDVPEGTVWEQSVTVELSGGRRMTGGKTRTDRLVVGKGGEARVPRIALAAQDGWGAGSVAPPEGAGVVLRTDLRTDGAAGRIAEALAGVRVPVEIEAVLPDEAGAAQASLAALATSLRGVAGKLASLTVLPAAYLQSYQPEGQWPVGVSPIEARAWAVARFPGLAVGHGVLTNFTELNRLPRRDLSPNFVTYGTTAVVHAADDEAVMQTLVAQAQIHASAAALYPGVPIRLGLVSLGMRSNPYGSACAPNPGNIRQPGAMIDPRQRGLFGAAFMVGAVAATVGSRVERIALGALAGPFALVEPDGTARPVWYTFRALAALAGAQVLPLQLPAGLAGIAAARPGGRTALILANTTAMEREIGVPADTRAFVLDQRSAGGLHDPDAALPLTHQSPERITLGPYAIGFADFS